MPNAKNAQADTYRNILLVGETGAGKTMQITTLPGRKFVYIFDPNSLATLKGFDVEYEKFLPDKLEIDASIKGFNKGARPDDKSPASKIEPTCYVRWVQDMHDKNESGFFNDYDWVCFDSMTFLQKACMDRCLYINNRYGKLEDLSDYRIVGLKLASVFRGIYAADINIFCTGHINSFQDEKTKKIMVMLNLHGQARSLIPLGCSDVFECFRGDTDKGKRFLIRTMPDTRGLKCIRTTIRNLKEIEDVTIERMSEPEKYGIGKLINLTTT